MIKYTVRVYANCYKEWLLNGKLHREDGPAIEHSNGTKKWFFNGKLHRKDGPAIEHNNGTKKWFFNGKIHREDGPAVEYADGTKGWYLNGKAVTKEKVMNPVEEMTMEEICKALGKNVKVIK